MNIRLLLPWSILIALGSFTATIKTAFISGAASSLPQHASLLLVALGGVLALVFRMATGSFLPVRPSFRRPVRKHFRLWFVVCSSSFLRYTPIYHDHSPFAIDPWPMPID